MPPAVLSILEDRFRSAAERSFPGADLPTPLVLPARDARHGDYSSPVAMSLARVLRRSPPELAAELAGAVDVDGICEPPEVAGGFVNVRLRPDWLAARLAEDAAEVSIAPPPGPARRVVIDYSAPNVAKEMHVGHLRSTIIGDCLGNVLELLGDEVHRVNHIGDWGAQFGMLLAHLEDQTGPGDDLLIADVEAFYREANTRDKEDDEFRERARRRVVELQSGEPSARQAWSQLVDMSRRSNQVVYDLLGISGLEERGESFYQPMLAAVVDDLAEAGLLVDDQGARVVFVEGFTNKQGDPLPLIVQNRHGGYGYATTDLAAVRHRIGEVGADRVLYVVDAGQSQHLEMVFAVARAAGWVPDGAELVHVPFGLVLGEDGKRLRTRQGGSVRLGDLLEEAVERARAFVVERAEERGNDTPGDLEHVARVIGVGAVKYADLSQSRTSNYVFSFDRMLTLKGNTAPYLQYAYARMRSILREAGWGGGPPDGMGELRLDDEAEVVLAKRLVEVPDVVERVADELAPHHLCAHLYEVSQAFNAFYERCPVLRAEEPARTTRLLLCERTAATLRQGLAVLGIDVLERI